MAVLVVWRPGGKALILGWKSHDKPFVVVWLSGLLLLGVLGGYTYYLLYSEITIPTGDLSANASPTKIGLEEETNVTLSFNLVGQSGYMYSTSVIVKEDISLAPDKAFGQPVTFSGPGRIQSSFRVKGSELGYITHIGAHMVYGEFKIAVTTPKGPTLNIVLQTPRVKIEVSEKRTALLTVDVPLSREVSQSGEVDRYSFTAVAGTAYAIHGE